MKRKISWLDIWHADASRLKISSTITYYQFLRSYLLEGRAEYHCAGKGILRHIMSVCSRVLGQAFMGSTIGDMTRC